MYVKVRIHAMPDVTFVRVPEQVVRPGKIVWRVRDGILNILGPIPLVQLVETQDGDGEPQHYWLTPSNESGLTAGDQLVVTPLTGVADGMPVRNETTTPRPSA
jgi:hypothetical protein